jgi:hypothetical protein
MIQLIKVTIAKQGRHLEADVVGNLSEKDRLVQKCLSAHKVAMGATRDGWRLVETEVKVEDVNAN